jgi:hypothetical protein
MYCIQMCIVPQDSYTLYILTERHNTIQQTTIISIYSSTLSLGTYGTLFQGYDSNVRTNNKELCTRRMGWLRFSLQDESPTAIRHYV